MGNDNNGEDSKFSLENLKPKPGTIPTSSKTPFDDLTETAFFWLPMSGAVLVFGYQIVMWLSKGRGGPQNLDNGIRWKQHQRRNHVQVEGEAIFS